MEGEGNYIYSRNCRGSLVIWDVMAHCGVVARTPGSIPVGCNNSLVSSPDRTAPLFHRVAVLVEGSHLVNHQKPFLPQPGLAKSDTPEPAWAAGWVLTAGGGMRSTG